MKLRVFSSLLLFFFPACQLAAQATSNTEKFSPPTRTFHFTYNFTVKDVPRVAKRVRVWVPVPPPLVALRVTVEAPPVVGIPEMSPVVELIARPAGSPLALKLVGLLVAVIW